MVPEDETFDATFSSAPHFSEEPGFRMHHADQRQGEPIVLLHAQPTRT